jgi:ribonuclease P protein component
VQPSQEQPERERARPPRGLPASRRLKRQGLIRPLFDRNRKDVASVAAGCVRLVYRRASRQEVGLDVPVQVGFAAGRAARKAVVRNRIKRVMREVYRVHQHVLVDLFLCSDDCLTMMVLFRGDPSSSPGCIQQDLPEAMRKLAARFPS